jgi:hypothetical protein
MAFIQMEDSARNSAEVILFPKTFKLVETWLDSYQVFIVRGSLDLMAQQKCKIKANDFVPLDLFFQEWPTLRKISLTLPMHFDEALIKEIKELIMQGSIPLEFLFQENVKQLQLMSESKIAVDAAILQAIEKQNVSIALQI